MENKQLKITLVKSLIGRNEQQRKIVKALGLTKIGTSVVRNDDAATRGIIQKIGFMLKVEEM
ncbi:MAG: 50S ribosomal protein L30 [Eubacteriaceae bacterium]|nr:50S ribosomal protein L30 [Eubacteriaceae bacterium]